MPAIANSQSIRQSLQQVLQNTKEGKTQLPDFQRSWVWHNEQISSLLASVSLSYPIGAALAKGAKLMRQNAKMYWAVLLI